MYGIIYMIRNKINNKIYFGQTTLTMGKRYGYNIESNTHNQHLKSSILKYGIENFEIVEQFDVAYSKEELDLLEDMYIKIYNTTNPNNGYNKKYGGANGKHTKETCEKIGKSVSGTNNGFYGKHHTEETKLKLSEANKGKTPWSNRTHTEESKNKISESKKGTQVGAENPRANKVICLNNKQIFDCAKDAGIWSGSKNHKNYGSAIIGCCRGKRKSAGKHPKTGEKLKWMYYEDYLNLIN